MIALLALSTGFALRAPAPLVPQRAGSLRLCEPPEDAPTSSTIRTFNKEEEKALRKTRLDFGGYPAGPYFALEQSDGPEAAYAQVRKDHSVLSAWSDDEIKDTVNSLDSTFAELLIYSPIGPFLVLSFIAIWRDGLDAWGIPPCKDYVGLCASLFG